MKEECGNSHELVMAEQSGADFLNEVCLLRGLSNGKEFRMTVSNKGKRSLVREGYMYRLDHSGKDKLSWRCSTRGCPAHLKTDHSAEIIVLDNEKPHTHEVDAHKFEKQLLRVACKRKAVQDCSSRTQDIISSEMTRLCGLSLGPKNTKFLQLAMYRERKKVFPKLPRTTRSGKSLKSDRQPERKLDLSSGSVTSIPQPHIPDLPTAVYSQPSAATYQPHFDLLTEDTASDYHHQHPNQQHHDDSSLQHHTQQLHQQEMALPPHLHQHLHHQQHLQPLESTLPQTVFLNSHLMAGPALPALTSEAGSFQQFNNCVPQTKICATDIRAHEDLLLDKVRTLTYRRALQENRARLKGATVLELGAGTGILSHFAVHAGATRVYAVEPSGLAAVAERVAREGGLGSTITVVQGRIENVDIPVKVDAIICEWMGDSLLCQSMLPSLLTARDRYLKQGGDMYPCSADLYLAPITDEDYQNRSSSWKQMKQLYGVSMDSVVALAQDALAVPVSRRHLEGESVLANACQVCHLDLKTMTLEDSQHVKADFTFCCYSPNTMHGFVAWFIVVFPGSVVLDTSPYALKTHWGQTGMYLKVPVSVEQGSEITGVFRMLPAAGRSRGWDIKIDFQLNQGIKYTQQWECGG